MSKLNVALIGGASDSLIGPVHVAASQWDGRAKLVAGIFSRELQKSQSSGKHYGVDPSRCYHHWDAFLEKESPDTIDLVIIATPNSTHVPFAAAALNAGFHVMCEKPLGTHTAEAEGLRSSLKTSGKHLAVAHHNTGYKAVRHLKDLVSKGELGQLRVIRSHYIQGWLADPSLPSANSAQAKWRLDPKLSGPSCCLADIGTHALNLMQFVSGEKPLWQHAELKTFVDGRSVDDFCHVHAKFGDHTAGYMTASQISAGYNNEIELHCDGSKASASWHRTNPEELIIRDRQGKVQTLSFPSAPLTPAQQSLLDLGSPNPEIPNSHAFANLYSSFYDQILGLSSRGEYVVGIDMGIDMLEIIDQSLKGRV